ncbi:MAG: hypothetical protein Q7R39_13165 [Dehalococcoidia bacterium]|nr:hypothetical protein [Dehalococcoidia bacterium]
MPAKPELALTIGLGKHASLRALIDGTVKPEGIDLTCVTDVPEPWMMTLGDRLLGGQFGGSEFSTSYFTQHRLAGAPLVAIPVFPYRSFRHRCIFCSESSGIRVPADLKGKRIGLHSYAASTMIWVRGLLRDEYGVLPQDIHWYSMEDLGTSGARASGVSIDFLPPPPDGITQIEQIARMIARGELDAGVSPSDLTRPGVRKVFANSSEVEAEYYRRTGIYPIIHSFVVNERIFRDYPWAPRSLLEACRKSAALTSNYVGSDDLERWDHDMWETDRHILGDRDPNSWGMGDGERRSIEAFWDYLILDGVIASKPDVDTFYPPFDSYAAGVQDA